MKIKRGEPEGERRQQQRRHEQQIEDARPGAMGARDGERRRCAENERKSTVVQNATTRLVHAARCI